MRTIEHRRITDRGQWLAWRADDLTASDLAAVAGFDQYRSALAVYSEKAGLIVPAETNIMRRGRWLEAAILEALHEELPDWRIAKANVYLRDPVIRLGATPDFIAEDPDDINTLVNIQGKVVARPTFERDWPDGTAPIGYQLQTICEGMLLGAERNLLAALVLDTYSAELVLVEVPRHAAAEHRIREIAIGFWDNMTRGWRPRPDYKRDGEIIDAIHKAEKDTEIDLSGDNRLAGLLPERAELKATITACEGRVGEIDTEIKDKLGSHERGSLPGWRLSWKEETRKAYTVAASTRRVLRVTEQKEQAA